jgi:hypothetical protein
MRLKAPGCAVLCIHTDQVASKHGCLHGPARTCSAGLMVLAVVWMAPDTMPSASPVCTIMTPYMLTSLATRSAATCAGGEGGAGDESQHGHGPGG